RLLDFFEELDQVCNVCSRKVEDVKVLFATKYLNPEQFVSFLNICKETMGSDLKGAKGLTPILIGENRVQEAEEKLEYVRQEAFELLQEFSMIMIGTLQKNKINKAIKIFTEIHSIDSLDLADELNRRLERENRVMPVFLEVNVSKEESKHGFRVGEIGAIIKELKLLKSLKLEGLMTMAPYGGDLEEIRGIYRKLKELADGYELQTSMGMSSDWKVAVSEGTDMIRIGSRIFE
ncbi:YggS family pyridoxal phosphate-dependent enzyme, partial [Candidatus Gottesmanbacteria bacterium]|nr:YggS family pyridoxal phosphate-dependent enzyme [Candidatus Gottesmanbacteria bacterium]